jgi:hypothetical protein
MLLSLSNPSTSSSHPGHPTISTPNPQAEFAALAADLAREYPDRARLWFAYDEPLSHLIYAGADVFLVPSMFEPCGLTQMIAMRYGTVPVVRRTGGLNDTGARGLPVFAALRVVVHCLRRQGRLGTIHQGCRCSTFAGHRGRQALTDVTAPAQWTPPMTSGAPCPPHPPPSRTL